jgi:hypothetical protein
MPGAMPSAVGHVFAPDGAPPGAMPSAVGHVFAPDGAAGCSRGCQKGTRGKRDSPSLLPRCRRLLSTPIAREHAPSQFFTLPSTPGAHQGRAGTPQGPPRARQGLRGTPPGLPRTPLGPPCAPSGPSRTIPQPTWTFPRRWELPQPPRAERVARRELLSARLQEFTARLKEQK